MAEDEAQKMVRRRPKAGMTLRVSVAQAMRGKPESRLAVEARGKRLNYGHWNAPQYLWSKVYSLILLPI